MAKRILAYILFTLGFLTITFFREYSGTIIPYPFLFWVSGLAMFWAGWAIIRWTPNVKDTKENEGILKIIEELKSNGEKIKVEFSKCEIKENNYLEEKEKDSYGKYLTPAESGNDYDVVRTLTPHYSTTTEMVQTNQSVILFEYNRNNKSEIFRSNILRYERVTLLFKLDLQKETILYVDKMNPKMYYFDLEFLRDEQ